MNSPERREGCQLLNARVEGTLQLDPKIRGWIAKFYFKKLSNGVYVNFEIVKSDKNIE